MSHDELVDNAIVKDLNKLIRKQMKAIETIFELHKPTGWFEDTGYADQECVHCDNGFYPCPTIQAIEKKLI